MHARPPLRTLAVLAAAALACGRSSSSTSSLPPVAFGEGTAIAGAPNWKWIPFDDAFCTDMASPGVFTKGTTGLAVSWGTGKDLVFFLAGGGACWDFLTCGGTGLSGTPTATTGPFGPAEFATDVYAKYPSSWVHRGQMPAALATATVVFVPYCTGDVHAGDKVTTYSDGSSSITWWHVGHANVVAFLKRFAPAVALGPADKLVVAGSSAGGFGALANYETIRAAWPEAKAYLVDDSGPPLVGDAIPVATRAAWYLEWNMAASLGAFCPECPTDLSRGLAHVLANHPSDRVALLSHTEDGTIRDFFGTFSLPGGFTPMSATTFHQDLVALGKTVLDTGSTNGRFFYTASPTTTTHPALLDPTQEVTPSPGLPAWIEQMASDDPGWVSVQDP